MDLRDSFSRLKKKLKHPLTRGRRKPERAGADAAGEGPDRAGSLPRPEPHPEVRVEGREKVERIHPSPSAPSILESGKLDSMWTLLSRSLSLIAPPDTSTVQADREPEVLPPDRGFEPSTAADKNESNWKSTVPATAKLILRTVKESSDAFPPLKSVVGGLCAILDNYEVRYNSRSLGPQRLQ